MADRILRDDMTRASIVAQAAECCYGDTWQSALARDHGLNLRTVQRIAAAAKSGEDYRVPWSLLAELAGVLREQADDSLQLAWEIEELVLDQPGGVGEELHRDTEGKPSREAALMVIKDLLVQQMERLDALQDRVASDLAFKAHEMACAAL